MKQRFDIGDLEIDGDDYFLIIEPVFWSVSIYDGPERYEQDLGKFSTEQRLVLAYHWYMSEVNNGGHDQFYFNSTGIIWRDALDAFIRIGPAEVAAIIVASADLLGGTPSLDQSEREHQLNRFNPDFEDLDQQLFTLQDQVNFDEHLLPFIRAHRDKFYFSGLVDKM